MIELMVVVAMIGIVGSIAIPSFVRESRKARYDSEVSAIFAELSEREDMYKSDTFKYHASAVCPAATNDQGTLTSTCLAGKSDWVILKAKPTFKSLRCTYQVSTGCSADTPVPPAGVTFNRGVSSWYFMVATCGMGTDTYTYFTSSTNPKVQKLTGNVGYTTLANCSL